MVNTGLIPFDQTGDQGQVPFTKANVALANLVQSVGEIAAAITPVNYNYPPGSVDRYGTNASPGATSMVGAFNKAITVSLLSNSSCPVTYGATGLYLLDGPVNGTWGGNVGGIWVPNHYSPGLTIKNIGSVPQDGANNTTPFYGLYIKHNQSCGFDFTGQNYVTLINPSITTHPSVYPKVGILGSRAVVPLPSPPGGTEDSGGVIIIRGGRISGHFSIASYYNYGMEADSILQCYITNQAAVPNTSVVALTANNYNNGVTNAVQTPFTLDAIGQPLTQSTGSQSLTIHDYIACEYANFGGQSTSDVFYFDEPQSVSIGGWATCPSGQSIIHFDGTNGPTNSFDCLNLSTEQSAGLSRYGLFYDNNPTSCVYHRIGPRKLTGSIASIYSPNTSTVLAHFDIADTHDNDSNAGINIAGNLQNSTCNSGYQVTIGTSQQNVMIGDPTQWTIGAAGVNGRNKDRWISRTATTTFSVGIATTVNGWTVSGLTQAGYFEFIERSVKFRIVLTTSGNIAWTANATIPTLPGFALTASGPYVCDILDGTTGAYLSAGIVANTGTYANTFPFGNSVATLLVAHTTSSDTIIIKGEYYVA